ncbi:MAG TPA: nucleotide exchange factor GrpE [Pyrinomonadaceae bacterium]|nr:nucleotide exchange factor GrpE [Pyrinomonadaceae bacterium]
MAERTAAEEARAAGQGAASAGDAREAEGIRVTDRRRVQIDDSEEGVRVQDTGEAASLKPKYVEELEARTRAAEQTARDVQARFEQVRAELRRETDEIRQRLTRTADERAAREKAAFVGALLPVMDNLQRAVEAAETGGTLDSLLEGLRGTISGFESAITSAGVEAITATGAQFDPELHEAVDTVEVEPARDGLVVAEYSRGYRMGGQLLRPARVQVGRTSVSGQAAATE